MSYSKLAREIHTPEELVKYRITIIEASIDNFERVGIKKGNYAFKGLDCTTYFFGNPTIKQLKEEADRLRKQI